MCGIAGLCNFQGDIRENLQRMNQRMEHRGPDAGGIWVAENETVGLGHRRLAIIDRSAAGAQPMESRSGRYVITFNGEIYNYKALADRLLREKEPERFRGGSDTEVLLAAIEGYGLREALVMCKGMFALAVYDKKEHALSLARDRVGEKPLYYGTVNGALVFASEISAIAGLAGFNNAINQAVLDLYFIHGYIPAPYSIYQGISKLLPGTVMQVKLPVAGAAYDYSVYPYWSMAEAAAAGQKALFTGTRAEAAAELERLLTASIRDQMVADVPVGAFLSAGIDSSTIVALMQAQSAGRVKSFTIGMNEKEYDEAVCAKEIAAVLGTEHTELYISEADAQGVIPLLAGIYGEPFADSSQIPTYLVSKMTREHVTVSLSGDGGDELFCGYNSYASVERIWGKIRPIPYFIRKPLSQLVLNSPLARKTSYRTKGHLLGAKGPVELYLTARETDPLTRRLSRRHESLTGRYSELPPHFLAEVNHNIMLTDLLMYHPDDILVKVDRAAMAVSLETRVPMLDREVIEFAFSLPVEYKRCAGVGKAVLRDVLYRYVPRELVERPKKGFSIPIEKWLRQPALREWAESLLDTNVIRQQGLLDPDVVKRMWDDFIQRGVWRIQIWYVLMFQQWYDKKII